MYSEIGKDGKNHVYRRCLDESEEEPAELPLSDVTVYGVNLPTLFRIIASAFGCGEPQPVANMAGAWNFGMSTFAPAKHKRRVFFVRHLAMVPESTFATYPGCIVIAAGGLKPIDADTSLFSFDDMFRYGANGLVLDLDAVSLRFEKRMLGNKPERKPNKAMLAKSRFRSRFHLSESDRKYIEKNGMETIRRHCEDFIRTRLRPGQKQVLHIIKMTFLIVEIIFTKQKFALVF